MCFNCLKRKNIPLIDICPKPPKYIFQRTVIAPKPKLSTTMMAYTQI